MDNTSHSSSVTLGSQVRRIFRHRLLILLSVVVTRWWLIPPVPVALTPRR